MTITKQIAKHLRDVHLGGNWTSVNLRDKLADVSWEEANRRVGSFHPIATLVFHINYYVVATIGVLEDGSLSAQDKLSFDSPPISSQAEWESLRNKTLTDAAHLAGLIEALPEDALAHHFVKEEYGTYFRCLQGMIEHCHYHLGQISIIKSLIKTDYGSE